MQPVARDRKTTFLPQWYTPTTGLGVRHMLFLTINSVLLKHSSIMCKEMGKKKLNLVSKCIYS